MGKIGFQGPYNGRVRIIAGNVRSRECLRCLKFFRSMGVENRICPHCTELAQKSPPSEIEFSAGPPR